MKQSSVITSGKKVIINGKSYEYPAGSKGQNVTVINSNVYVNGYELIDGEWKKTLKALWYRLF